MMSADRDVIAEAVAEHGWVTVADPLHSNVIARGDAQIILGYSPSGRALQLALYYPEGRRDRICDPRPHRSAPREGCLEVALGWIRTGDADPVNSCRGSAIVIPCCAAKRPVAAPAGELYDSDHFRFTLRAAQARAQETGAQVWILSAKFGLLPPGEVIEPYDVTFGDAGAVSADAVYRQLCVFGIGQLESLLPRRYKAVLAAAVDSVHRGGGVLRSTDLYAGAAGIGYQRAVLSRLLLGVPACCEDAGSIWRVS